MWPVRCTRISFISLVLLQVCSAITDTNFNEHIREYSVKEEANMTNVTTLMKQGKERYSHFVPIPNPVTLKAVADNLPSSSSYSRGLQHHADYGLHDYEEHPHQAYGYEYHIPDTTNYDHHSFDHHLPGPIHTSHGNHHGDYHGDHYGDHHTYGHHHVGHHYKHHDHALAAKTLLWPIAGIALLGAAAALVSNPVLLQLGVVSGRRKRRDTEEVTGPDDAHVNKWTTDTIESDHSKRNNRRTRLPLNKLSILKKNSKEIRKQRVGNASPTDTSTDVVNKAVFDGSKIIREVNYIPIPLKMNPAPIKTVKFHV